MGKEGDAGLGKERLVGLGEDGWCREGEYRAGPPKRASLLAARQPGVMSLSSWSHGWMLQVIILSSGPHWIEEQGGVTVLRCRGDEAGRGLGLRFVRHSRTAVGATAPSCLDAHAIHRYVPDGRRSEAAAPPVGSASACRRRSCESKGRWRSIATAHSRPAPLKWIVAQMAMSERHGLCVTASWVQAGVRLLEPPCPTTHVAQAALRSIMINNADSLDTPSARGSGT